MRINIKKAVCKVMLLTIVTLMWVWTSIQASAGYIEWVFVWNNAQEYQNKAWFKAWLNLFKMLKWTASDKYFVEKYAKSFSQLIDSHLSTNNVGWEKETLLRTVSALSKDIVSKVEWNNNSNNNNNNYHNSAGKDNSNNNNNNNWGYNSNYLNDVNKGKDDNYYGNNNSNNMEEEDNDFWGFGWNYWNKNNNNNNNSRNQWSKSSYSKDDLWRDMYSIKGNEWYIKSIWKPWKTKDDYAYHIKAAELVRSIISDSDSDSEKIEKIHEFLKNKYYSNVWADPVWNLEEYTSRATNLWADKTRGFALPFNWWQWVCQGYNDMYSEMLQIAWVKGTIQKQTWYAPTGVAHMHLLVNWRVTDALWKWSAFNSKIFDLTWEIRNNFNYN